MLYFWLATITLFILYYYRCVVKRPTLVCKEGKYKDFLMKHCTIIHEKYWPTWWCFEGRIQTALTELRLLFLRELNFRQESLLLRDGGRISLDWFENGTTSFQTSSTKPIVLFIPGVTADSQAFYFRSLIQRADALGFRCVVANYRGRGGQPLLTPRIFCGCNCEDLIAAIDHIKSKYPKALLIGTGISMGGLILSHYLVQSGSRCRLSAAMTISSILSNFEATEKIEGSFWNSMLIGVLGRRLASEIQMNEHVFKNTPVKMDNIPQVNSLKSYDKEVTSKIYGYNDVDDYYTQANLYDKLHQIQIPFLILNSNDDPFQPITPCVVEGVNKSSHVALLVTARGGHVAFLEGLFPFISAYMDRLFLQFITVVSQNSTKLTEISEHL